MPETAPAAPCQVLVSIEHHSNKEVNQIITYRSMTNYTWSTISRGAVHKRSSKFYQKECATAANHCYNTHLSFTGMCCCYYYYCCCCWYYHHYHHQSSSICPSKRLLLLSTAVDTSSSFISAEEHCCQHTTITAICCRAGASEGFTWLFSTSSLQICSLCLPVA